jgi:hypothetical protein
MLFSVFCGERRVYRIIISISISVRAQNAIISFLSGLYLAIALGTIIQVCWCVGDNEYGALVGKIDRGKRN